VAIFKISTFLAETLGRGLGITAFVSALDGAIPLP
jgi:hypothetical protein